MSTTPEYAEELLIKEREDEELDQAAHGSLPRWEDLGEDEVVEAREAEEETHHAASEPAD